MSLGNNKKRYVMAVIRMPVEIVDIETCDFECIQDSASVSIESCEDLPLIDKKDGYEGMADKIKDFLIKKEEKNIPMVGVGGEIFLDDFWSQSDCENKDQKTKRLEEKTGSKKHRKHFTYRRFSLGHRHTLRNNDS